MTSTLTEELQQACMGLRLHEPLSHHASWGIGGPADYYAEILCRDELIALRRIVQEHSLPVFFLGAGSNILISDKGIRGLVIRLQGEFRESRFEGETVFVGASVWMPALVKQAAERGLSGIEALIGVPGTIGGGLVMNAGTRDGVLGDVVDSVEVLREDAQVHTLTREQAGFRYRHSALEGQWILGATLGLKAGERSSIMSRIDAFLQYRARTQPLGTSNCGSVFKNPSGDFAARLIEQAGLKGVRYGGAQVSERHANFILNEKNATAQDVWSLIQMIQNKVKEMFHIQLETEVKRVGQW